MILPAAAVDLEYVDSVLREFAATGLKPETVMFSLVVVALVCLLGVAGMFMRMRQMRLKAEEPPVGWVTETPRILELLQAAMDNRSKVDMSFHAESGQARKSIFCSIYDMTGEGLLLELPAMVRARDDWEGRPVDCYFQVPYGRQHDRKIFYYFVSNIREVTSVGTKLTAVRLALPDSLVLSQRRNFMRITPPAKDMRSVLLLPETKSGLRSALKWFLVPSDQEKQPGAGLAEHFRMDDISGEGMKVSVHLRTRQQKEAYDLSTGKNYYALLHLGAPAAKKTSAEYVKFLMLGVVRQSFHNPQSGETEVGMQFVAMCEGVGEEDGKPQWKMIRKMLNNPLEQWVVDKYLEIFREQGVEPE